jgi:uncharacterized protein with NAD-binding domain and iron-sulfur cluster
MVKKIAILGGGPASLTTAFWLTNQAGWKENYEITIYQLGWRLGGKLWNGRVEEVADRDEEHGYHILFGFYKNAFETFKQVYDELDRNENQPISRLLAEKAEDEAKFPRRFAFHRFPTLHMAAEFNGVYKTIPVPFPTNELLPYDGEEVSFVATIANILGWISRFTQNAENIGVIGNTGDSASDELGPEVRKLASDFNIALDGGLHVLVDLAMAIHAAFHDTFIEKAISDILVALIRAFLRQTWEQVKDKIDTDWDSYFYWCLLDIAGTVLIGLIEDDVWDKGYDGLNNINFYDWILKHGNPVTPEGTMVSVKSFLMEFAYLLLFAYRKGDATSPPTPTKPMYGDPNIETGTLLRFLLRLVLNYKGAFGWEFQVNAGDALVAPTYELLKKRGVKFKFFHKVTKLHLSDDKKSIQSIDMFEQVNLRPTVPEYQPLYPVKDVMSWPHHPLYDQLDPTQVAELLANKVDLESHWTDWTGTPKTLLKGVHFDDIVLGISLGALDEICSELRDNPNNSNWRDMLKHVETIRSFGFQTWLNKTTEELGWDEAGRVISNTAYRPVNLKADTTQVIPFEDWKASDNVKTRGYFGGLMPDDPNEPPAPNPAYPKTQSDKVKEWAIEFLNKGSQVYWPNAVKDDEFDWKLLVDKQEPTREGAARFNSQFWVASIDPTGRYVLAVVNSSKYRLAAGESGYSNLYLTGDWTKTGLNCGTMEATVMSGMNASRAISGYPSKISGETDFTAQDADVTIWERVQSILANPLVMGVGITVIVAAVLGLLWVFAGQGA